MMGPRHEAQGALFYEFSIEEHVPQDHILRAIDRFVDLGGVRQHLAPFYSSMGRPLVDPELMIRMVLVGYSSAWCRHRSEAHAGRVFGLSAAFSRRCISTLPTGGSVGSI